MKLTIAVKYIISIFIAVFPAVIVSAQEEIGPIMWNPFVNNGSDLLTTPRKASKKTTISLPLPFFEDFTGNSPVPDSAKWVDFMVYINNTMAVSPISRGVATFDDLDYRGLPYDSFSNSVVKYADSLTSMPINLSADSVGDSVYLSFFYQPQGNGFYPTVGDSLMLFFKNKFGDFIKVWSVQGSALTPFQQVMIPLTDSLDFHEGFQFRFINIASLAWADAVWNLDYIKLDRNRTMADTVIADIAFTSDPPFLLNDYTSMPYSQFKVNPTAEIVTMLTDSIRNDSSAGHNVNYNYRINDGGFTLGGSAGFNTTFLAGHQTAEVTEPLIVFGYPNHPANTPVIYEARYYLQNSAFTGPTENDTVVRKQVFDNYLAYDDGTAEKSYYLHLATSAPGKIAIEYHLNKPDTIRGMSIYFGRQVPFANRKPFIINLYAAIGGINGAPADNLIYSTDQLLPAYADEVNHFWTYIFDVPQVLPAGTFYVGTSQTANDGSDSLYYGFDVNRVGSNHAFYNVEGIWKPVQKSGAIMMRPIIGKQASGSYTNNILSPSSSWQVMPNPATDMIKFQFAGDQLSDYNLSDCQGHIVMQGTVASGRSVNIAHLAPGVYFVNLSINGIESQPQKIVKM